MFFSVITKNLNWEVLVTFRRWNVVNYEKF